MNFYVLVTTVINIFIPTFVKKDQQSYFTSGNIFSFLKSVAEKKNINIKCDLCQGSKLLSTGKPATFAMKKDLEKVNSRYTNRVRPRCSTETLTSPCNRKKKKKKLELSPVSKNSAETAFEGVEAACSSMCGAAMCRHLKF